MSGYEKIAHRQEFPPEISQPNVYPLNWPEGPAKLEEIWQAAQTQVWDPAALPWSGYDVSSYTWEQREAIGYWWTLIAVFDASAPAVMATAFVKTYEAHEDDVVRRCFFTITRDEGVHEQMCKRAIQALLETDDPLNYEPKTELGQRLQKNVAWLFHNAARYWDGYRNGVPKHSLPVLFASFLMGEIAAATIFHQMAAGCTEAVFQEAFRKIGRDEGRHMGICLALMERDYPQIDPDQHQLIAKQIRAGYLFLSAVLYEPSLDFWDLPADFIDNQREGEEVAREAGFFIPTFEDKRDNWRQAMLNLKGVLDRYAIPFPALPEIDISGVEVVDVSMEDIIPVF